MKNRFIVLAPFYNVKNFIFECYQSVLNQNYDNWLMMLGNDASTDKSETYIPNNDPRFVLINNKERLSALPNEHNLIMSIPNPNPEDILIILDGDDKLLDNTVFEYLNDFYNSNNALLVYGNYVRSNGGPSWARAFKNEEEYNNIRTMDGYILSHIRSWKYKVYQEFLKQDPNLSAYKNRQGDFFRTAADVAMMIPLVEIAGYNNVKFNSKPVYWYRIHENNDHTVYPTGQLNNELIIKSKPKFKQMF